MICRKKSKHGDDGVSGADAAGDTGIIFLFISGYQLLRVHVSENRGAGTV